MLSTDKSLKFTPSKLWDAEMMTYFDHMGDYRNRTFEFARAHGAGINPKMFPREEVLHWTAEKTDASQIRGDQRRSSQGMKGPYRPLTDPYDIRVLEILPGQPQDNLRGVLHHCSVEFEETISSATQYVLSSSSEDPRKPVWYTALSYTWGAPVFDAVIEVDGHRQKITKSLESALRHFRQPHHSIVLWIDQICINQNDEKEKTQQIPLMSKIYQRALNTLIWVGEAAEGSAEAFALLQAITVSLQFLDEVKPEDFDRLLLPSPSSASWRHLWELLGRPWFQRLWIIQEVVLSNTPWIMCGNAKMLWDEFSGACSILHSLGLGQWLEHEHNRNAGSELSRCQTITDLVSERDLFQKSKGNLALFSVLVVTRYARSYMPHDKVYGLLGICDAKGLEVSYAKPAADVYRDTVTTYIKHAMARGPRNARWVIMLPLICVDDEPSPDLPGIPSWVPDWRTPRQTEAFGYTTSTAGIYAATSQLDPQVAFNADGFELVVTGKIFDTLTELSGVYLAPDISLDCPAERNGDLASAVDFAQKSYPYPGSGGLFSAFWKTLVAGKNAGGMQKCPCSFEEIFSLVIDETTGRRPSFPDQTYSARQQRPKGKGRLELASLRSRKPGETLQEAKSAMRSAMLNRRMGRTGMRYLGLFPRHAVAGDMVCVFFGGHVPFVVRRVEGGKFQLVGECYVHGAMDGEVLEMKNVNTMKITLI